jgi:hypothetical protein
MAKPKKNQSKSNNRGGPRPNSGRKPKPVTAIKQALITELVSVGEVPEDAKNDAAVYAFRLFDKIMRDDTVGVTTRLDCATEILNRVWGKATERRENVNKNETTHIFVSQLTAALKVSYGQPSSHAPTDLVPVNGNGKSH